MRIKIFFGSVLKVEADVNAWLTANNECEIDQCNVDITYINETIGFVAMATIIYFVSCGADTL